MSSDYLFSSTDNVFKVKIAAHVIQSAIKECITSFPLETGGVLAGSYDKNGRVAEVRVFTPPPGDSKSSRAAFYRGIAGLKKMFLALWQSEEYYLGEWHYHPNSSPSASSTDVNQMKKIANSEKWQCPEPVLVIIGRIPADPVELGVYVYPKDKQELIQLESSRVLK